MASNVNVKQKQRKKVRESISSGRVHIKSSFNNTLVIVTNPNNGGALAWATAGGMGFKGSRKSTPYAAQQAATKAGQAAKDNYNMHSVEILIEGPGPGREAAARAIANIFKVTSIVDVTGIPHNGCRPPKERRV
jgi:small subunit ribosomal protein S11